MVTFEPILNTAFLVRLCETAPTESDPRPAFTATAVIEWDLGDDYMVWIKGFHGTASRQQLRALILALHERGIKTCLAIRNGDHTLPMSRLRGDGVLVTDVAALAERALRGTRANMLEHNTNHPTVET